MRFSLATLASILPAAHAIINGIAVPETIKPGEPFDVIILRSNYIQSVQDVAIAFGSAAGNGYPQSLGALLGSFYLGPAQSNKLTNLTESITVPATTPLGDGFISASLMSLWGVVYFPQLSNYNVSVTFGNETSSNYVTSYSH